VSHWTLGQDNDPKHTSNSTKAWLQKKSTVAITVPDLNLWWDLKKAVAVHKNKNITELNAIAHEEYAKIPEKHCQ